VARGAFDRGFSIPPIGRGGGPMATNKPRIGIFFFGPRVARLAATSAQRHRQAPRLSPSPGPALVWGFAVGGVPLRRDPGRVPGATEIVMWIAHQ